MRGRPQMLAAVAVLAAILGVWAEATDKLRRLEYDTVDLRFQLRGDQDAPDDVVVVGIDGKTLSDVARPWPFPRRLHGRVIDRLRRDGADVIAYDIEFLHPTDDENDYALLDAVDRADRIVLATTRQTQNGEPAILDGVKQLRSEGGEAAAVASFADDPGGELRRLRYSVDRVRSFAVEVAEAAERRPITDEGFDEGLAWVDYAGPAGTYRAISFSDVLNGRFRPGIFRGKTVVIGATNTLLKDLHPAPPKGELMSGPEIQANAISTVRAGVPLRDVAEWVEIALVLLLAALAPALTARFGAVPAALAALGTALAYSLASYLAFDGGRVLSTVVPLATLAASTAGSVAVDLAAERIERRRIRDVFGRFVPADVVDEAIEHSDAAKEYQDELDATVLFCDLAGFTTFAEKAPPRDVREAIDHYLTNVATAIRTHEGTVVSYEGDSIMAVWGAPVVRADHAERALDATREITHVRMPAFLAWLERNPRVEQEMDFGVGVATGPVVSAFVGPEWRLEYAAVGRTTVIASRVQAATRSAGCRVLITEHTIDRLHDRSGYRKVGRLPLRNVEDPPMLWTFDDEAPA